MINTTNQTIPSKHSDHLEPRNKVAKQNSVSKETIFTISAVVFLFIWNIHTSTMVIKLQNKVYEREREIISIQSTASEYGTGPNFDSMVYIDSLEDSDNILSRTQRSTKDRSRGKKKKKRSRNQNKNKHNKNKENAERSEIGARHLVINEQHPSAIKVGEDLKTGVRESVIPYWKFTDNSHNYDGNFAKYNDNGTFTIQERGLYQIYSQMTYFDRTGRWSHMIAINGISFIKALASEWGIDVDPEKGLQYNTIYQCYTSGVTYLQKRDLVSINSLYPERVIHTDTDLTFWGIIKLT